MKAFHRVLTLTLSPVTMAAVLACGDNTGPAASRNSPGTGTNTLRVTADIDAKDDAGAVGGFTTEYLVTVRDGASNKVSGATVTISNPSIGTLTLPETGAGSGDYFVAGSGFPGGDFRLNVVRGTDNVRDVILGGPGVHTITTPVTNATVAANQALTVRWTVPSRATQAEVETKNFGPQALPDTGAYVIPAGSNPAEAAQQIRVFRYNEVSLAGGLLGSRLRVEVRNTVEPVSVQ
ncbi:MAG TPA: hypothetical protein VFU41_09515 [Gemmatimonadales bacterium]|nr:hypothetical protein [Gemmatimonadales bacterium]